MPLFRVKERVLRYVTETRLVEAAGAGEAEELASDSEGVFIEEKVGDSYSMSDTEISAEEVERRDLSEDELYKLEEFEEEERKKRARKANG